MAGKGDRALQISREIADAQDMLANGVARRHITRHLRNRYGLKERVARARVQKAVELMTQNAQAIDRTELAAQLHAIYEGLISDAKAAKQFNASINAATQLAKLAGLIDQNRS